MKGTIMSEIKLNYHKTHFLTSAPNIRSIPEDTGIEIAFAGRSNAGKSTALNVLTNQKSLARTSKTPGRTQLINLFEVEPNCKLVDLPGYGFAKASQKEREKWGQFIESYLLNRDECQLILQMVDLRHPPTKDDIAMYQWLKYFGNPVQVVATKADKISKGQYAKNQSQIRKSLGMSGEENIILFSAETGLGVEAIDELLTPYLKQ
mgnify:CR=1 FL=1